MENEIVSLSITEFDEIPAVTARGKVEKIFVSGAVALCVKYTDDVTLFTTNHILCIVIDRYREKENEREGEGEMVERKRRRDAVRYECYLYAKQMIKLDFHPIDIEPFIGCVLFLSLALFVLSSLAFFLFKFSERSRVFPYIYSSTSEHR